MLFLWMIFNVFFFSLFNPKQSSSETTQPDASQAKVISEKEIILDMKEEKT